MPVTTSDLARMVGRTVSIALDGATPRILARGFTLARGAGDSYRAALDSVAVDFTPAAVSRVTRQTIYLAPRDTTQQ